VVEGPKSLGRMHGTEIDGGSLTLCLLVGRISSKCHLLFPTSLLPL